MNGNSILLPFIPIQQKSFTVQFWSRTITTEQLLFQYSDNFQIYYNNGVYTWKFNNEELLAATVNHVQQKWVKQ